MSGRSQLLYSRRRVRSPMIEPGRGLGYLSPLLGDRHLTPGHDADRCAGRLLGRQATRDPPDLRDRRLPRRRRGRDPDDLPIGQPVPEDNRLTPGPYRPAMEDPSAASSRAPVCGASVSSEQVATDGRRSPPDRADAQEVVAQPLAPPARGRRRHRHRRPVPVPALPEGRPAGRRVLLPRVLHREHPGVPGPAHRDRPSRRTPRPPRRT